MTATIVIPTHFKDPDEVLDYGFDWSDWLDEIGDTISTSAWEKDSASLTVTDETKTTTSTTVWLSAGVLGETYFVTNRIVTVGGRTADRSFWLRMATK